MWVAPQYFDLVTRTTRKYQTNQVKTLIPIIENGSILDLDMGNKFQVLSDIDTEGK